MAEPSDPSQLGSTGSSRKKIGWLMLPFVRVKGGKSRRTPVYAVGAMVLWPLSNAVAIIITLITHNPRASSRLEVGNGFGICGRVRVRPWWISEMWRASDSYVDVIVPTWTNDQLGNYQRDRVHYLNFDVGRHHPHIMLDRPVNTFGDRSHDCRSWSFQRISKKVFKWSVSSSTTSLGVLRNNA